MKFRPGDEHRAERTLGRVLQVGVLVAGAIVLAAGAAFIAGHALDPASFRTFAGQPASLRSPAGVVAGLAGLHAADFIQFGLLVLIATPVLRVAMSVYLFARSRDLLYVAVTLIVLGMLAFGLISGR
jgi:uncharacterized membrane protein